MSLALLACSMIVQADREGWSQFRGPNGSGIVPTARPPLTIVLERATWQTAVPTGKSSPILWGGRVFLTGLEGTRLVTLAIDAASGGLLWQQSAPAVELERVHTANSVAASTPCVDADSLYVYFGSFGLLCYDHQGRERWQRPLPTPASLYGTATSPVIHQNRLILVLDDEANLAESRLSRSRVVALDCATGATVWETPRPYQRSAWSTPMIWPHDQGADLVVLGNGRLYGYDPATGQERWYVNGFAREPIAVPVAGDGHLYVSVSMQGGRGDAQLDPEPFWTAMLQFDRDGDGRIGRDEITQHFTLPFRPELPLGHPGFGMPLPAEPDRRQARQLELFAWRDKNRDGFWTREEFTADMTVGQGRPNLMAIEPGGRGDITESHVRWNQRTGIPEIPSPIFHAGRLYLVRDGGILSCVRAATGEVIYRERLGATGQYQASPVIANGHLYLLSASGQITVVRCGDQFTMVHQADLQAPVSATPALDRQTLYVRTDHTLMAFR
ncbi:MAG: hypothetical protein FJ387_22795 [Verrucomicrobia bacterium]|nr:hypothetical protein [Verrucomicrobiota bacterium]